MPFGERSESAPALAPTEADPKRSDGNLESIAEDMAAAVRFEHRPGKGDRRDDDAGTYPVRNAARGCQTAGGSSKNGPSPTPGKTCTSD